MPIKQMQFSVFLSAPHSSSHNWRISSVNINSCSRALSSFSVSLSCLPACFANVLIFSSYAMMTAIQLGRIFSIRKKIFQCTFIKGLQPKRNQTKYIHMLIIHFPISAQGKCDSFKINGLFADSREPFKSRVKTGNIKTMDYTRVLLWNLFVIKVWIATCSYSSFCHCLRFMITST